MVRPQASRKGGRGGSRYQNGNGNSKRRPFGGGKHADDDNDDSEFDELSDDDNGFGQWGGYMAAKKAKLDQQFHYSDSRFKATRHKTDAHIVTPQIFKDIEIYINGYTSKIITTPPEPELREMFVKHGGHYTQYPTSATTYIIATNLSAAKKRIYGEKTIKPEWIVDSINEGRKLDYRGYLLYNFNAENKQLTLTQAFKSASTITTSTASTSETKLNQDVNPSSSTSEIQIKHCSISLERLNIKTLSPSPTPKATSNNISYSHYPSSPELFTSSQEDQMNGQNSNDSQGSVELFHSPSSEEHHETENTNNVDHNHHPPSEELHGSDSFNASLSFVSAEGSPLKTPAAAASSSALPAAAAPLPSSTTTTNISSKPPPVPLSKMKTAAEDGFLQEFYNNSRLHLISTLKKERQQNVSEWRKNLSKHNFVLVKKYKELLSKNHIDDFSGGIDILGEQVLLHIDLDCFFVSVARLSRPELANAPVVITHSKGNDSKSDIACASYEARAKGIEAGMWLFQAKELCPEIVAIPYEFEEYSRVSKMFYETVASLTLEMEAISCDEMLINVTTLLKSIGENVKPDPVYLAKFLILEIQNATSINASIGIGANRLIAKIATRLAKDNKTGCHALKLTEAQEYIRQKPVNKLPGVGWATAEKLESLYNVKLGGELETLSLEELKKQFGDKTGQKLYSACRGIDSHTIKTDSSCAKSISAGCSFGVRLSNSIECEKFLKEVAEEAVSRATAANCYCNKMALTLWIARKGYEKETVKPGGHGIADVFSKSLAFKQKTRDVGVISASTLELARLIMKSNVPPEHIRGVSISLDGLIYEQDISERERKLVQPTLMAQIQKHQANMAASTASATRASSNTAANSSNDIEMAVMKDAVPGPSKPPVAPASRPGPLSSKPGPLSRKAGPLSSKAAPASSLFQNSASSSSANNCKPSTSTNATVVPIGANPYIGVEQLDPDYLAALPDDVRAEVELEFQKAKHQQQQPSKGGDSNNPAAGSSKGMLLSRSPPRKKFIVNNIKNKKSPIRKKKIGSPSKSKLKTPPKKIQPTSKLGSNSLFKYYSRLQSVSKAKKSLSPVTTGSTTPKRQITPQRRLRNNKLIDSVKKRRSDFCLIDEMTVDQSLLLQRRKQPAPKQALQEENNSPNTTLSSTFSDLSQDGNRLTQLTSSNEILPSSQTDSQQSLEPDLQRFLQTTPTKKSVLEVEEMILSFNNDDKLTRASSTDNSNSRSSPISKSSTDMECGQPLIKPPKHHHHTDKPSRSNNEAHVAENNNSAEEQVELQAAILKSFNHTSNYVDGTEEEPEADVTMIDIDDDDRLSIANNINDSDHDQDLDELDLLAAAATTSTTTDDDCTTFEEIELPPLNGETEIPKVHELIRAGIADRTPTAEDIESLTTYFHELSGMFLTQTCNSLRFLQALQNELVVKGGHGSQEWINVFTTIIKTTQETIQEAYGGFFAV